MNSVPAISKTDWTLQQLADRLGEGSLCAKRINEIKKNFKSTLAAGAMIVVAGAITTLLFHTLIYVVKSDRSFTSVMNGLDYLQPICQTTWKVTIGVAIGTAVMALVLKARLHQVETHRLSTEEAKTLLEDNTKFMNTSAENLEKQQEETQRKAQALRKKVEEGKTILQEINKSQFD